MLDAEPDPQFDRIVELAAAALGRPFAGITLAGADRLFVKAHVGAFPLQAPRAGSPCEAVIEDNEALTLADARADARFEGYTLIADEPKFRYWSGVPVSTAQGQVLGVLWVADVVPDPSLGDGGYILAELAQLARLRLEAVEMQRVQQQDHRIAAAFELVEGLSCILLAPDGTVRSWYAGSAQLFGIPAEEAIGQKFWDLPIGVTVDIYETIARVLSGEAVRCESSRHARDGRRIDLIARWSPVFDADGKVAEILGVGVEVTIRRRLQEHDKRRIRVLEAVARLEPLAGVTEMLVDSIAERLHGSAVMIDIVREASFERVAGSKNLPAILEAPRFRSITLRNCAEDAVGSVIASNAPAFSSDVAADALWSVCGKELAQAGFHSAWSLPISVDGRCLGVATVLMPGSRAPGGAELTELETATALIAVIVGRYNDQERLVQLASFDPLTGAANREAANRILRERIEAESGSRGHTAVALIDLNDFKKLNDAFGHHAGDQVLQSVARSLEASLAATGTVARLGGDEFLLILNDVEGIAEANLRVERALAACRTGAIVDGRAVAVDASAGISFSSADTSDPEALIRQADRAMYVAKRNGISQAVFRGEMLTNDELQTVDIARELAAAVANGLLFVAYQPEVDLRDGRIVAVEALARWNHPRLGDISPEVFIRLAEATDQIGAIGDFVLKTALRDGKRWQRPGHPVRVSINFSPRQLQRPDFVRDTLDAIARTGFDRNLVDIEVAERFVVGSSRETVVSLQTLRAAGPHIVVDDLGSGRVNLTLLRDFPLDVLKLDRSFTAPLGTQSEYASRAVIAGLVTMAGLLHVRTVAEGVDLPAQLRAVRELGCDAAQGDLIVSAISADQVEDLLAQDRSLLAEVSESG